MFSVKKRIRRYSKCHRWWCSDVNANIVAKITENIVCRSKDSHCGCTLLFVFHSNRADVFLFIWIKYSKWDQTEKLLSVVYSQYMLKRIRFLLLFSLLLSCSFLFFFGSVSVSSIAATVWYLFIFHFGIDVPILRAKWAFASWLW